MEDILEFFADQERLPPSGLGETLLDASDCLEIMVEHLLGMGAPPEQSLIILRRLSDWAARIERDEGGGEIRPAQAAMGAP